MDNAIKLLQKQKERTADEVFIYRNKTPFTFNRPAGGMVLQNILIY
jgi:hypothetical protein